MTRARSKWWALGAGKEWLESSQGGECFGLGHAPGMSLLHPKPAIVPLPHTFVGTIHANPCCGSTTPHFCGHNPREPVLRVRVGAGRGAGAPDTPVGPDANAARYGWRPRTATRRSPWIVHKRGIVHFYPVEW